MRKAGGGSRTPDLLITNQLLYQLSYASIVRGEEGPKYTTRHKSHEDRNQNTDDADQNGFSLIC